MCKYSIFYGEYENKKETGQKKSPSWRGFEPQFFEQVPTHNLNFEDD